MWADRKNNAGAEDWCHCPLSLVTLLPTTLARPCPTCPWPHRAGCCTSLPSSARLGHGTDRAGSTCPGPLWRRTQLTWPGRRRRSCGWGRGRGSDTEWGRAPYSWPGRQPSLSCSFPGVRRPVMSSLTGSGWESYGCRIINTSGQNVTPSTVGSRDSRASGQGCWVGRPAKRAFSSWHPTPPTSPLPAALTCGSGPSCLGATRSAT